MRRTRGTLAALVAVVLSFGGLVLVSHLEQHAPDLGFVAPGQRALGRWFRQSIVGESYLGKPVIAVAEMPSGQAIDVVAYKDGDGHLCIGAGNGPTAASFAQQCDLFVPKASADAFGLSTGGTERLTVILSGQPLRAAPPAGARLSDPVRCPDALEDPCWIRLVASATPIPYIPVATAGRTGTLYPRDIKRLDQL